MFAAESLAVSSDFVTLPDAGLNDDLIDFWWFVQAVVLPGEGQTWGRGPNDEELYPSEYRRAVALLSDLVDKAPEAVPEWLGAPVEGEPSFRKQLVGRLAMLRAASAHSHLPRGSD